MPATIETNKVRPASETADDLFDMETTDDEEVVDEQWGDELTELVSVNADEVIRCPWMDDAEVTLSHAMNTYEYPPDMTAAYEPFLISVVNELLASRGLEEDVESEEELAENKEKDKPQENTSTRMKEPDQKSETKPEIPKAQIKPKTTDSQQQPEKITDDIQGLEVPISNEEEKRNESKNNAAEAIAEVAANSANDESAQPALDPVIAEATTHSSKGSIDPIIADDPTVAEVFAVTTITPGASGQKPVIHEIQPDVQVKRQAQVLETADTDVATIPIVEEHPAPAGLQLVVNQELEPLTRPPAIEAIAESNYTEPLSLELKSPTALADGTTEPTGAVTEVIEDQPAPTTPDYQMETSSLIDFDEKEVLIDHPEEASLGLDEQPTHFDTSNLETTGENPATEDTLISPISNKFNFSEQQEVTGLEQRFQASLTNEEIEDSLIELAERIKASDSQTTEMANESLDKIIEVPAELETSGDENIIAEARPQEELEELFTELLDTMGTRHTPELIKYLAHQTLTWHLVDEIEKLKDEEETDQAPQDSGTHVIIKKLIAGLKTIKKATRHAYAIGRSALALYSFNFAT